ncbi:zinc-binding domain-containing protein [Immersiella caudata]|uniref:Zinc-binding domain-containing protein n=1 Tax=Immersiella caudata TaxID=314043 RepID=A0AA39WYS4_9PEZI|nr:zinc-binding domain-containing protein [Immersiella caudata]
MEPPTSEKQPLPCPDWVLSSLCNVHIARDRPWFGQDYTPFPSILACGLRVEGVGSVELPTKHYPKGKGRRNQGTLHLSNVLHVPEAACNFLGAPLVFQYALEMDWKDPSRSFIRDQMGTPLASFRYASDGKQFAIHLSGPLVGPKVGPLTLSAPDRYDIRAIWPDAEQYRWIAYKTFVDAQVATIHEPTAPNPGLEYPQYESAQGQGLIEGFSHAVTLEEHETRDRFMFPQLDEAVQLAVDDAIPSLWFNHENDEDDEGDKDHPTSLMGDFVCTNRSCPKPGWSSKKVSVWIRLWNHPRPGGYNAVVYNQRCSSCNCLGTLALDEQSYVDRVSYRLRKWAGAVVTAPLCSGFSRGPHVEELCEGCKHGHCV